MVVLARELQIEQVAEIYRQIQEQHITGPSGELVRIEMFCHGALCMAVSGKCYLSLDILTIQFLRQLGNVGRVRINKY